MALAWQGSKMLFSFLLITLKHVTGNTQGIWILRFLEKIGADQGRTKGRTRGGPQGRTRGGPPARKCVCLSDSLQGLRDGTVGCQGTGRVPANRPQTRPHWTNLFPIFVKPGPFLCTFSNWKVNHLGALPSQDHFCSHFLFTSKQKMIILEPCQAMTTFAHIFIHKLTENDHCGALPSQDHFCIHFYSQVNRK